ncbi:hypothetical protein B0H10DRAFT_1998729 [Mycena sp. CBHHK59/15]|nr:hypothetical protein B0H10DRAFT_1998729 [Mycena sp. CBHHK59/15]
MYYITVFASWSTHLRHGPCQMHPTCLLRSSYSPQEHTHRAPRQEPPTATTWLPRANPTRTHRPRAVPEKRITRCLAAQSVRSPPAHPSLRGSPGAADRTPRVRHDPCMYYVMQSHQTRTRRVINPPACDMQRNQNQRE